jgi:hypothetical protein
MPLSQRSVEKELSFVRNEGRSASRFAEQSMKAFPTGGWEREMKS